MKHQRSSFVEVVLALGFLIVIWCLATAGCRSQPELPTPRAEAAPIEDQESPVRVPANLRMVLIRDRQELILWQAPEDPLDDPTERVLVRGQDLCRAMLNQSLQVVVYQSGNDLRCYDLETDRDRLLIAGPKISSEPTEWQICWSPEADRLAAGAWLDGCRFFLFNQDLELAEKINQTRLLNWTREGIWVDRYNADYMPLRTEVLGPDPTEPPIRKLKLLRGWQLAEAMVGSSLTPPQGIARLFTYLAIKDDHGHIYCSAADQEHYYSLVRCAPDGWRSRMPFITSISLDPTQKIIAASTTSNGRYQTIFLRSTEGERLKSVQGFWASLGPQTRHL